MSELAFTPEYFLWYKAAKRFLIDEEELIRQEMLVFGEVISDDERSSFHYYFGSNDKPTFSDEIGIYLTYLEGRRQSHKAIPKHMYLTTEIISWERSKELREYAKQTGRAFELLQAWMDMLSVNASHFWNVMSLPSLDVLFVIQNRLFVRGWIEEMASEDRHTEIVYAFNAVRRAHGDYDGAGRRMVNTRWLAISDKTAETEAPLQFPILNDTHR